MKTTKETTPTLRCSLESTDGRACVLNIEHAEPHTSDRQRRRLDMLTAASVPIK